MVTGRQFDMLKIGGHQPTANHQFVHWHCRVRTRHFSVRDSELSVLCVLGLTPSGCKRLQLEVCDFIRSLFVQDDAYRV